MSGTLADRIVVAFPSPLSHFAFVEYARTRRSRRYLSALGHHVVHDLEGIRNIRVEFSVDPHVLIITILRDPVESIANRVLAAVLRHDGTINPDADQRVMTTTPVARSML